LLATDKSIFQHFDKVTKQIILKPNNNIMSQTVDFNITVDGAPYVVKATPHLFNGEKQYNVAINNGDDVLFAFDPSLGRYAPVGDDATDVPDNLELAIGAKLNSNSLDKA
jgi:hypothetical protein